MSYQSRGQGVLAPAPPVSDGAPLDRLAALIGPGRARLLLALKRPSSTTALAHELKLAPSTVSEQLSALLAAEVVYRRRSGRRVIYGLEPAGDLLLSLLGSGQDEQAG
nr:winged helix-turn-helix domain-containing protein [Kineosporia babensis]